MIVKNQFFIFFLKRKFGLEILNLKIESFRIKKDEKQITELSLCVLMSSLESKKDLLMYNPPYGAESLQHARIFSRINSLFLNICLNMLNIGPGYQKDVLIIYLPNMCIDSELIGYL